jgi:hypothetical protein
MTTGASRNPRTTSPAALGGGWFREHPFATVYGAAVLGLLVWYGAVRPDAWSDPVNTLLSAFGGAVVSWFAFALGRYVTVSLPKLLVGTALIIAAMVYLQGSPTCVERDVTGHCLERNDDGYTPARSERVEFALFSTLWLGLPVPAGGVARATGDVATKAGGR